MKIVKKLGLILCGALLIGGGLMSNYDMVQAKKVKDAEIPETILEGKLSRKIKRPNEEFEVKVTYGIGGVVFANQRVPLQVTLTSKENFNGEIRVVPMEHYYGGAVTAVGKEISLAKDSAKTFSVVGQVDRYSGGYYIQIVDEDGDVVYIEEDTMDTVWANDNLSIATLTDDFSGLSYFDGINVLFHGNNIDSGLIEMNEDIFPNDYNYISSIPIIILNNFDTSKFSEEQYIALKQWVADGGVLIVGLGVNADKVLNCFNDDFLEGNLGKVSKKDIGIASATNVDVAEFELKNGTPMSDLFENSLVQYKTMGAGTVVVLGFDLSMEPLASSPARSNISNSLLQWLISQNKVKEIRYEDDSDYGVVELAQSANESPRPNALVFAVLFVVYSVMAGPICYLILKKKNKREYIWIAMPMLSVVFTFIVWATSSIYRVRKPMINMFTVVNVADGLQNEQIYMNNVCPKVKSYRFKVHDVYSDVHAVNYGYYHNSLFGNGTVDVAEGEYTVLLEDTNDGKQIEIKNRRAFDETNFAVEKTTENIVGQLTVDLKSDVDGYEGTITNTTSCDLTNVVIVMDQKICVIPELKKGESAQVEKSKLFDKQGYDSFYDIYHNTNNTNVFNGREMKKEYTLSSNMERMYCNGMEFGQGYIWASIGTYVPEVVQDNNVVTYGRAVILQKIEAHYDNVDNGFCPNLSALMVNENGPVDVMSEEVYGENATVTYSFEGYRSIDELKMHNVENKYYGSADVYAFNPATGDYEQLFVGTDLIKGEELKKYLEGDILVLRFVCTEEGTCSIPRISVQGVK